MSKPSVFVGSSNEGLEVARAIQSQLADVAEPELWNERTALGSAVLESLVQALDSFDFAAFVLTPDDLIVSRGVRDTSARDNVLIALGLFMGRFGRERTFLVCCKDDKNSIRSRRDNICNLPESDQPVPRCVLRSRSSKIEERTETTRIRH